jgi:hypothetical protein
LKTLVNGIYFLGFVASYNGIYLLGDMVLVHGIDNPAALSFVLP